LTGSAGCGFLGPGRHLSDAALPPARPETTHAIRPSCTFISCPGDCLLAPAVRRGRTRGDGGRPDGGGRRDGLAHHRGQPAGRLRRLLDGRHEGADRGPQRPGPALVAAPRPRGRHLAAQPGRQLRRRRGRLNHHPRDGELAARRGDPDPRRRHPEVRERLVPPPHGHPEHRPRRADRGPQGGPAAAVRQRGLRRREPADQAPDGRGLRHPPPGRLRVLQHVGPGAGARGPGPGHGLLSRPELPKVRRAPQQCRRSAPGVLRPDGAPARRKLVSLADGQPDGQLRRRPGPRGKAAGGPGHVQDRGQHDRPDACPRVRPGPGRRQGLLERRPCKLGAAI